MAERDELLAKNKQSAETIKRQADLLASTVNPTVARQARDEIFEQTEQAVERVDRIARIDDAPKG
jgi:hypothetical protein